jgi:hypothetical protein
VQSDKIIRHAYVPVKQTCCIIHCAVCHKKHRPFGVEKMNRDDGAFKFTAEAEKFYITDKVTEMVCFSHGGCKNGCDFWVIINICQSCYYARTYSISEINISMVASPVASSVAFFGVVGSPCSITSGELSIFLATLIYDVLEQSNLAVEIDNDMEAPQSQTNEFTATFAISSP